LFVCGIYEDMIFQHPKE